MSSRILIVEDDSAIANLLDINLKVAGYETARAADGRAVPQILSENENFDLALLDIMLPGMDGFELLPHFNERKIPVIFLTAKDDIFSKVRGLKSGAEDYIVKPFEILELLVRIEKVLERNGRTAAILTVGEITIDLEKRNVWKGQQEIFLKPMEYDLLVLLAKNPKVTFTREQLLKEVWGETFMGETRTVDVHIARLRKKLDCPEIIRTVSRIGYRLEGM